MQKILYLLIVINSFFITSADALDEEHEILIKAWNDMTLPPKTSPIMKFFIRGLTGGAVKH
ncbi:MAG: hypothetical protein AABY84_08620 [Candidatus Firestonebacteria bacterium]